MSSEGVVIITDKAEPANERLRSAIHEAVATRLDGSPPDDVETTVQVMAALMAPAAIIHRLRSTSEDRERFMALAASAWDQSDEMIRLLEISAEDVS